MVRALEWLLIFIPLGLIVVPSTLIVLAWGLVISQEHSRPGDPYLHEDYPESAAMCGGLALLIWWGPCLIHLVIRIIPLYWDTLAENVRYRDGIPAIANHWYGRRLYIHGKALMVSRELYESVQPGQVYRVYYLPLTARALSVEPLPCIA